jgi:hypothetical protein
MSAAETEQHFRLQAKLLPELKELSPGYYRGRLSA